jgi:hypothetical protein
MRVIMSWCSVVRPIIISNPSAAYTLPPQIAAMNISELSLRRPVLAVVLNVIIIVFGLIGFNFWG